MLYYRNASFTPINTKLLYSDVNTYENSLKIPKMNFIWKTWSNFIQTNIDKSTTRDDININTKYQNHLLYDSLCWVVKSCVYWSNLGMKKEEDIKFMRVWILVYKSLYTKYIMYYILSKAYFSSWNEIYIIWYCTNKLYLTCIYSIWEKQLLLFSSSMKFNRSVQV